MEYLVKGVIVDTPTSNKLRIRDGYLLIKDKKVVNFYHTYQNNKHLKVYDFSHQIIIPGLVDLHLHASQYNYTGTAMDLELMDWLKKYAYPEEAKFKNLDYAKKTYHLFVNELVKSATTRACIFASIHNDATIELMNQLEMNHLPCYVGKVAIDRNAPNYYCEKDGVKETIRYLETCRKKKYQLVKPILTPRFTPSVTDKYMKALGELAKKYCVAIQSHLSENLAEINFVKKLRPYDKFYAESYSKYGLFGNNTKTVMAHCIYSNNLEKKLMKKNGVYIAHCPTSNVNVIAGICPAAMYLREGYHIGLGSDIAGGNTLDLFEVMKVAIQSSKNRYKLIDNSIKPLCIPEVLYMATKGGGSFFGKVGLFEEGYEFDAIVIDDKKLTSMRKLNISERVERIIYLSNRKIISKFVSGRQLF